MQRARELATVAKAIDPVAFEQLVGPFALMQRPQSATRTGARSAKLTVHLPPMNVQRTAPAPTDFGELQVATLPPLGEDGSLDVSIGRGEDCTIVIDDETVSAHHATILWNRKSGMLVELGSANGTFLNGLRLGTKAPLKNGDELSFGRTHFVYLLAGELYARLKRL